MLSNPGLQRSVAIVGAFHHGKTLVTDLLVKKTLQKEDWPLEKEVKYLDSLKAEQNREMSLKMKPFTSILQNSKEKSFLF